MRNKRHNQKSAPKAKKDNDNFVFGYHAVKASLMFKTSRALKLNLVQTGAHFNELSNIAQDMGVKLEKFSPAHFDNSYGKEIVHQGVMLETRPFSYVDLDTFLEQESPRLCMVLDGIEDPRNLGRAARLSFTMGADLLIIPKDRAAKITATAEKAAAGCLSRLPVALVTNLNRAIESLKNKNIWVVGAAEDATEPLWACDFTKPTAIIVGNEEKGIRAQVKKNCDLLLQIPMPESSLSINAADAAGCFLYEALRQKNTK